MTIEFSQATRIASAVRDYVEARDACLQVRGPESIRDTLLCGWDQRFPILEHPHLRNVHVLRQPDLTGRIVHIEIDRDGAVAVAEGHTTRLALQIFKLAPELATPLQRRAWVATMNLKRWLKEQQRKITHEQLNAIAAAWLTSTPYRFELSTPCWRIDIHTPNGFQEVVTITAGSDGLSDELTESANNAVYGQQLERWING